MADICVVHLVRASNGLGPFGKFLECYFCKRAGREHDLLIIYKGFPSAHATEEYEKLLGEYPHRTLFVNDFGFDIGPYLSAVKAFDYRYYCFLNSYSEILSDEWLEKLYLVCSREDVGLVGATASWQSLYSDAVNWKITLETHPVWKYLAAKCLRLLRLAVFGLYFPPFPNYHIRTNAFMVKRETILRVKSWPVLWKLDAWRFESSSNSLTRQIAAMNLKTLLVGRNGVGYDKEDWHESEVYKQHDQSNLLVADNQTMCYELGDESTRSQQSFQAWGHKSNVAVCDSTRRKQ